MKRFFPQFICTQNCVLVIGLVLGVFLYVTKLWDAAEPIFTTPAVIMAVYIFLQTQREKKKTYTADNNSASWVVVLQVGRPVVEAVNSVMGRNDSIDVLIDCQTLLGDNTLYTDAQYKKLAQEVYSALEAGQNKKIHFFLSGPLGLSNIIGQMTPPHLFDMVVYHYDITAKGYATVPRPDRSWFNK